MSFCTSENAKSQTGPTFSDGTLLHLERFMLWKWKHFAFSNSPDATWNTEYDWSGRFLISSHAGSPAACQGAGAAFWQGLWRADNFRSARLGNPKSCSTFLMSRSCCRQSVSQTGPEIFYFLNSRQYGLTPALPAPLPSSWGQGPALQYKIKLACPNWFLIFHFIWVSCCTCLHLHSGAWCQTL